MKDIIKPQILHDLSIQITNPHYGGERYRVSEIALQSGVNQNGFLVVVPEIIHTITALEDNFKAVCKIRFGFKIEPIEAIIPTELMAYIYDCFVYTANHLAKILNTIYSEQLINGEMHEVLIPKLAEFPFNIDFTLKQIEDYLLS